MRISFRGACALSALCLVSGLLSSASAAAAGSGGTTPKVAATHLAAPQDPQDAAIQAIDKALQSELPDSYAGLEASSSGLTIHALQGHDAEIAKAVGDAEASFSADVRSAAPTYSVVPAMVALRTLTAKQATLTANADALKASGVDLTDWGVNIPSDELVVGVHGLTSADTAAITALVGTSAVSIVEHQPSTLDSRACDYAPWFGGDYINSAYGSACSFPGGVLCTSGFSMVNSSGGTFNSTAGHCGWRTWYQNGQGYGVTVALSDYNYGPTDAQIISTYPATAAGYVFYQGNSAAYVASWAGSSTGDAVCFDGYYTGEVCAGVNVVGTNECVSFGSEGTTCGLVEVYSYEGLKLDQGGDSGGPVYHRNSNGTVIAKGLIVGGPSNVVQYYTPVTAIQTTLGYTPEL